MSTKIKAKVSSEKLIIMINKFNDVLLRNVQQTMETIVDDYHDNVVSAVSGPGYGLVRGKRGGANYNHGNLTNSGKLPIPVRTGKLKKVTTAGLRRKYDFFYEVIVDSRLVPYARYVHDGTEYMQPRPFMVWVMRDRRPAYINLLKYAFKKAEKQV